MLFYCLQAQPALPCQGPALFLHLLLWAGPGASPTQRGMEWLVLGTSPGPGEWRAAQVDILSPYSAAQSLLAPWNPQHLWGSNWEGPGGEGDGPCARNPSWWAAGCKTKPWSRREVRGHSHSDLSLKPPCFQTLSTRPSTASPHARPRACCFSRKRVCSKRVLKRSKQ